ESSGKLRKIPHRQTTPTRPDRLSTDGVSVRGEVQRLAPPHCLAANEGGEVGSVSSPSFVLN
ncbi:MAG: hypothetical protein ACO3S4_11350, partial [Pseudohongiellaceae bacterium]